MIRCPSCGSDNRVSQDKLEAGLKPLCGRCKQPLPIPAEGDAKPVTVTDATFAALVEQSPIPVLVDAWAAWCGPCRMIAPVVDELAGELRGRVRVAKLNVDENPSTAARFKLFSIPTLLVIKGGREVGRIVGAKPKSEITRQLEQLVA